MNFKNVKFVKLGSITKWTSGGTPSKKNKDFWDGRIPWISARNLKSNFVYSSDITISELGLNNGSRLAPVKSILLLVRGSGLFNDIPIGLVEKEVAFNQDLKCIQADSETVLPEYIFYWLLGSKQLLRSILEVTGIGAGKFDTKLLQNLEIPLPSIEEQELIVKLCDSISRKIEINERISQLLENIAQVIFKQWFVDFEFPNEEGEPYKTGGGEMIESELGLIPKGWVVGKLDDIATIVMGQSPKGTSYNEVGEGEVFYQGRTDFSSRFPIRRLFTTEPKRMANDGDVLMSVRAPVGDLNVANERCCIGRGLSAISSSADLSSYILYVMHDLRERLNVYNGEGTVFGSINQKDLKSIKVISSCDNKTEIAFDDLIQPIDRMIRNNEDETRRLINLRDRLLPKLLSGEIRVPLDEEGDAS